MDKTQVLKEIMDDELELFKRKNSDYGDSFVELGIVGNLIRIKDKLNRALVITEKEAHIVEDENLEDTLMDLANYANLCLLLLRGVK
jgi:hypothetical protein